MSESIIKNHNYQGRKTTQKKSHPLIIISHNAMKTRMLNSYLNKIGFDLYPAHSLEDIDLLINERQIRDVAIPYWCDSSQLADLVAIKQRPTSEGLRIFLFAQQSNLEDNILVPWDGVILLPSKVFDNTQLGRNWRPDNQVMDALRQSLQTYFPHLHPEATAMVVAANRYKEQNGSDDLFADKFASKIIVQSPLLQEIFEKAIRVAPTEATILITGESGTGKELVADTIHHYSQRHNKPFLRINCAGLSASLVESELFGYERGAFTGAIQQKKGYFEAADSGTLFLDEIGELDMAIQAKLLRALEYGEIMRVGSVKPLYVNVRLVAATNRQLLQEVKAGRFREDLYYRLHIVSIHMPPLRERKEDIPPLFNSFMQTFMQKYDRNIKHIASNAKRALLNYEWPGNVRELKNTIEGLVVSSSSDSISLIDLPLNIREKGQPKLGWGQDGEGLPVLPGVPLSVYERELIRVNLKSVHGNRKLCALNLQISERSLYRKLKQYDLVDSIDNA